MHGWRIPALVLSLSLLAACQQPQPKGWRQAADPEPIPGWVEFVVRDPNIPADPQAEGGPHPPTCRLNVLLDRNSVMTTTLHPTGNEPPYSLALRFRVRAVAGGYTATFRYLGCRVERRRLENVEAKAPLFVAPDGVTQVLFDGSALSTLPPRLLSGPNSLPR